MTARNLQEEAKRAGLPWSAAKGSTAWFGLMGIGYDGFLPMSRLIPKHKIADPHNVRLELKHNGNVVQNSSTGSMLWKIPELFEAVTDVMKLNEWDIVLSMSFYAQGLMASWYSKGRRRGRCRRYADSESVLRQG